MVASVCKYRAEEAAVSLHNDTPSETTGSMDCFYLSLWRFPAPLPPPSPSEADAIQKADDVL